MNFSAKFWTRANTGQILYPGKPTPKFYWTTLKSYKLTLPLQLFDQRHLRTHATTKILVVLTKSIIFNTIFPKSSLDWFNTVSPEKITNLQDSFKITKVQVLWSLTISCTITDTFILLLLFFYFFIFFIYVFFLMSSYFLEFLFFQYKHTVICFSAILYKGAFRNWILFPTFLVKKDVHRVLEHFLFYKD